MSINDYAFTAVDSITFNILKFFVARPKDRKKVIPPSRRVFKEVLCGATKRQKKGDTTIQKSFQNNVQSLNDSTNLSFLGHNNHFILTKHKFHPGNVV